VISSEIYWGLNVQNVIHIHSDLTLMFYDV